MFEAKKTKGSSMKKIKPQKRMMQNNPHHKVSMTSLEKATSDVLK